MVPSEDFSSRGLIVGHPVTEPLNHSGSAAELKDFRVESAVVGRPVRLAPQNRSLVLDHELSRQLLEHGQEPVLELSGGGLVEDLEVHHHPLVVVGSAGNHQNVEMNYDISR